MNYKTLILSILVSPCALFAHDDLQELKQQYVLKQREVREITGEILEAYNRLQMIWNSYGVAFNESAKMRAQYSDIDNLDQVKEILKKENTALAEHVFSAFNGDHQIDDSMISSIFMNEYPESFCADKFFETFAHIEYMFIQESFDRYKKELCELAALSIQIKSLEVSN